MSENQQILEAITAVNRRLDTWESFILERTPSHTIRGAAKIIHVSEKTVSRWIAQGKIRRVRNRIPHSELKPFLS